MFRHCWILLAEVTRRRQNSLEGWHHRFNSYMSYFRPTIWKFISKLKQEQAMIEIERERRSAGFEERAQKKTLS